MDLEKGIRCLPDTLSLTLTSEYGFLISAEDVAIKTKLSSMRGQNNDNAFAQSVMPGSQYSVMPMFIPEEPIGTAMQAPRTESHVMEKKATTYLLKS
jgi:hypothetical protein